MTDRKKAIDASDGVEIGKWKQENGTLWSLFSSPSSVSAQGFMNSFSVFVTPTPSFLPPVHY